LAIGINLQRAVAYHNSTRGRSQIRVTGYLQHTAIDISTAEIPVRSGQNQRAGAPLRHGTGTGNRPSVSHRSALIEYQRTVVPHATRNRATRAPIANLQRTRTDRGAAICVVASQYQRAVTSFGQGAVATDRGRNRQCRTGVRLNRTVYPGRSDTIYDDRVSKGE